MKLTGSYALKVALIYAAVGALWIFFSDAAVERLTDDTATLSAFQTYKGWVFVLASSLLVLWLSWRALEDQAGLIRRLRESAIMFDRIHEGVIITDHRNRVISANPAFSRMTGRSEKALEGIDLSTLHSSRHDDEFFSGVHRQLDARGYWTGEIWNLSPDGNEHPYQATVTHIGQSRSGYGRYAWIFTDIGALKSAQRRLENLAYYDGLTRLPNRLHLNEKLRQIIATARDMDRRLAVLYIDLDHFRNVNDSFGHPVGDDLLVLVAKRLKGRLPGNASLAHLGGDEFLICLEDVGGSDEVETCASRILSAIAEPFVLPNHREVYVRASIGISRYPQDALTSTELLQYSNAAMYEAKKLGRNTWQYFTEQLVTKATRRLKLDARLRRAIDNNELRLHYQPIVYTSPDGPRICALEVLARWQQPDGSLLYPKDFIGAAEETGLIVPLGEWVMKTACHQAVEWQKAGLCDVPIAINLSAPQFYAGNLEQTIRNSLTDSGLPPEGLHLEITETMLMEQVQTGQNLIGRLREMGLHVSLDDFGTGYSSLSYLRKFDLDTLKIDRSFIGELSQNSADRDLVSAIISMAHSLRLNVVAEGVEAQEQYEVLQELGCDCFQGFLFGHPVPPGQYGELIESFGLSGRFSSQAR